jgi:hypothetical protein
MTTLIRTIFVGITAMFFLFGCARNVTGPKPSAGNALYFQVNFGSMYNSSDYTFYFVYSKYSSQIPNLIYPMDYYLFVPGDTSIDYESSFLATEYVTQDVLINDYYDAYFSSWSDILIFTKEYGQDTVKIIVSDSSGYFPSTANESVQNDFIQDTTIAQSSSFQYGAYKDGFYFSLDFDELQNKPAVTEEFNFNLLVVDASGKIVESLADDYATIGNDLNDIAGPFQDGEDTDVTPNHDILEWKALIQ